MNKIKIVTKKVWDFGWSCIMSTKVNAYLTFIMFIALIIFIRMNPLW